MALRLAIYARRRAFDIEATSESWSIAILGDTRTAITEIELAIDELHRDHVRTWLTRRNGSLTDCSYHRDPSLP